MAAFDVRCTMDWKGPVGGDVGTYDFSATYAPAPGTSGVVHLAWRCDGGWVDGDEYDGGVLEGGGQRMLGACGCVEAEEH